MSTLWRNARLVTLATESWGLVELGALLVEGERSVGELNARLSLSQPALSQHLAVLREDGLVQTRREAQTIYYSLVEGPAQRIIDTLHGIYCAGEHPLCEGT